MIDDTASRAQRMIRAQNNKNSRPDAEESHDPERFRTKKPNDGYRSHATRKSREQKTNKELADAIQ